MTLRDEQRELIFCRAMQAFPSVDLGLNLSAPIEYHDSAACDRVMVGSWNADHPCVATISGDSISARCDVGK